MRIATGKAAATEMLAARAGDGRFGPFRFLESSLPGDSLDPDARPDGGGRVLGYAMSSNDPPSSSSALTGRTRASGATPAMPVLGIRYAVDHGASVVNLSLGALPGVQALVITGQITDTQEAIAYARERGVVVVAAAGNDFASPLPPRIA